MKLTSKFFAITAIVAIMLAAMGKAYADFNDLIAASSYGKLAEAAAPDNHAVNGALLELVVTGADTSAYSIEDVAEATAAKERLDTVLQRASDEVNGYLAGQLPLVEAPPVLKVKTLDIALYRLFGGDSDSTDYLNYHNAAAFLRRVAEGKIKLRESTTDAESGARFCGANPPAFKRGDLGAA